MSNDEGSGPAYRITLTERERATVVAALDFWNAEAHFSKFKKDWFKIASQGGKFKQLTQGEVRRFAEDLRAPGPRTLGVNSP